MKVAVIYWSGTGNTESMANAVLEGAKAAGADAKLFNCSDFNLADAASYDAFALGCPAMGAKNLKTPNSFRFTTTSSRLSPAKKWPFSDPTAGVAVNG